MDKYYNHYTRRHWIQSSFILLAASCFPSPAKATGKKRGSYQYKLAKITATSFKLPANKTVPFDWPIAELNINGNINILQWERKVKQHNNCWLRITSATDVREEVVLELSLAKSQQRIGILDIRFAHYMQPFEWMIAADLLPRILSEGLAVKMIKGTKPFWFFIPDERSKVIPDAFLPHLLVSDGTADIASWKDRFLSLASLSTFGWMEGCVLDGLSMRAEKDANAKKYLLQHLGKYFSNNTLVYENLNNQRSAEIISTVESILPFAILAMQQPQHAMLQKAIDFCVDHADSTGVVADDMGNNRRLKTEECYTIAYPLAILAIKLNRPELEKMAIANLNARVKLLSNDDFIFQNGKELEQPVYGNWARGVGWYLLGLVKTLAVIPKNEDTKPLHIALQKGAELALRHQQTNGLWTCFLHQPETGIETSGSANIAAALAYGYHHKLLPLPCREAAVRCEKGLTSFLTPDGFLSGTAQVNKGGESLQRNGFRVISPYTLGFLGILDTSLNT